MSIQNVSNKIETYWKDNNVKAEKTPKGYYMFARHDVKLYIYPENAGATFMVIPTSQKYNINENMEIKTDLGMLIIDSDPKRSNPALIFGLSENDLNNKSINMVVVYMINNVENIFKKCQST